MFQIVNKWGDKLKIRHILKNGKEVQKIDGFIVKLEDAKAVYLLISKLGGRKTW